MGTFLICQSLLTLLAFTAASLTDEEIESLSYKSIKAIHKHLDDDQDGDVNLKESTEFMVDELQLNDEKRHSSFHGNDSLISVDDLWFSWLQSEVHNWTSKEVVDWLSNIVSLPQYNDNFLQKKIDGRMLPRFTNEASSLYSVLGITNVKHRKKISLRATDIVLFGPPVKGYTKDVILAIVVSLMALACWYAMSEKKFAKKQIEQMMKDVEFMQLAEENLKNTQEKLKKAELEHRSTVVSKAEIEDKLKKEIDVAKKEAERLHEERNHHEEERMKMSLVEQELVEVRKALQKAEAEMETMAPRSPKSLQQWLFITYRKESKHFISKKNNALKQMEEAKEACEKIRKKRGAFLGSLRLVHGQTIDEVDQKILSARSALAEVTNDLQERQHRWRQIEELCGFDIVTGGILNHSLEIEDQSRRSSIARALAVCANLGGIGSIPNSLPSKNGTGNNSNSFHTPSKSKADSGVFHGFSEHSEETAKSSPVQELMSKESSFDKDDSSKDEIIADDGLSFLSSKKDKLEPFKGDPESVSENLTMLSEKLDALTHAISKPYDEKSFRKLPRLKNNQFSMKDFMSMEATTDVNNKFHTSQSVPLFSSERQAANGERQTSRHSFVSAAVTTARQQSSTSSEGSNASLVKLNGVKMDNDESSKNQTLSSSEENLSQHSGYERCFGSNEELSTSKKGISKKLRLASFKNKKPNSYDGVSMKGESAVEPMKKKSILSKLRKK